MNLFRLFEIILISLWSHAFRSILAALGVVLGVGAVVGMMAISEGARRETMNQIRKQGIDNLVAWSRPPQVGSDGAEDDSVVSYGLTWNDVRHIQRTFENIRSIVPVRDFRQPIYVGGKPSSIRLMGTIPAFQWMTKSTNADPRGRWLTDLDQRTLQPVCVVGESAARQLFGMENPIGKQVVVGVGSFRVIGVLTNAMNIKLGGLYDLNHLVYIPLEAGNAIYGNTILKVTGSRRYEYSHVEIDYLYIKVTDGEQLLNTRYRLATFLEQVHPKGDFGILVPLELLRQAEASQRIFTIVMGSIAAISLLVGGIGIMNIMLANIYERTREIGIRRALGARKVDILAQFLLESVVLTGSGGILGIGIGSGIAKLVQSYGGMQTVVTLPAVLLSVVVSISIGILFGTYPAWKAATLDPITALRHE